MLGLAVDGTFNEEISGWMDGGVRSLVGVPGRLSGKGGKVDRSTDGDLTTGSKAKESRLTDGGMLNKEKYGEMNCEICSSTGEGGLLSGRASSRGSSSIVALARPANTSSLEAGRLNDSSRGELGSLCGSGGSSDTSTTEDGAWVATGAGCSISLCGGEISKSAT